MLDEISTINLRLRESIEAEIFEDKRRAVSAVKRNAKHFFSYAKKRLRSRPTIGPLRGGELITDPASIAEALQSQYISAYTQPCFADVANCVAEWQGPERNVILETVEISEQKIRNAILQLDEKSALGPDGVPAILLKRCAASLSLPLCMLWSCSLSRGRVPSKLKEGIVTPIPKGGDRGEGSNYRPVMLPSHVSKIFERIVAERLVDHLEAEEYLSPNQHGFRKGRSCSSQLAQHHWSVLRILERGGEADVVYLDFSKAFDKVDLGLLLIKLKGMGIKGELLRWVLNFLSDRMQKVVVEEHPSRWCRVISGVPQETVLGPILFLAHIVNIDVGVESTVSCFADDTRVTRAIATPEDPLLLQRDLEMIYTWASASNMHFNEGKFKVLRYTEEPLNKAHHGYTNPSGGELDEVSKIRDLGVLMENTGKFSLQVEKVTKKARQMMGWILRTFKTRAPDPMIVLFRAVVLPHLEYCCQVGSPVTLGEIRKLESVQRSFTARLNRLQGLNYWQRLERLKLYSLERRRERYLAIYTWKMVSGLVPAVEEGEGSGVVVRDCGRRMRCCVLPKVNRRSRVAVQTMLEASLPVFRPKIFNSLPRSLRDHDGTLVAFKRMLDEHLSQVPDRPYLPHYYLPILSNSLATVTH